MTLKELKEILKNIPDNYELAVDDGGTGWIQKINEVRIGRNIICFGYEETVDNFYNMKFRIIFKET